MEYKKGLVFAILSWVGYSLSDVFVKLMSENDVQSLTVLYFMSFFLVIYSPFFMKKADWKVFKTFLKSTPLHALLFCSVSLLCTNSSLSAFRYLPIPDIYIFFFTAP